MPEVPRDIRVKIRNGWIAACVLGVLLTVAITVALSSGAEELATFADPFALVDVALVFILAFFVSIRSRLAAILLLVWSVVNVTYNVATGVVSPVSSIAGALIYGFFFAHAVIGTFRYHRWKKEMLLTTGQSPAPPRAWAVVIGITGGLAGLVILTFVIVGLLVESGQLPETRVLHGDEITTHLQDKLLTWGIVEPDEDVLHYYSAGFLSHRDDGNILTDRRVISYWTEGDELFVETVNYDQIEQMTPVFSDNWIDDSEFWITTADGESILLWASTEEGRDRVMYDELYDRVRGPISTDSAPAPVP